MFSASLLQALEKQQESLLHFREAVKLAPWNFEAQKGISHHSFLPLKLWSRDMARYFSCLRVHRIFSNKRLGAYIKFRLKGGGGVVRLFGGGRLMKGAPIKIAL